MNISKGTAPFLLVSSLFLTSAFVYAQTLKPIPTTNANIEQIKNKLAALMGNNQAMQIEPFNEQLYLVNVQQQTFFTSSDGRYLYLGQVIDTLEKVDLLEVAKQSKRKQQIASIPRSQLLSYQAENEHHVITVFTDIDCPFCRKLHQNIPELNSRGVTVDYVMIPRGTKGTGAFNKTAQLLCAKNANRAMDQAMHTGNANGKKQTTACDSKLNQQIQLARTFGFSSTPTILLENGKALAGLITPDELMNELAEMKL